MNASSFILLFQGLRCRLFWNSLRIIQEKSLLRALSIGMCSVLVWGSLFALCYAGFLELTKLGKVPINGLVMGKVFDVMFFSLTVLLIFSTGIIIYSSLFASPESAFLLTTPAPDDHIFSHKLQGAIAFSSWAFVLLGSPVLIAYGLIVDKGVSGVADRGAAWPYYPALALFFMGFVLIPGTLGALLCLVLVNVVPRGRKQLATVTGLALLVPILIVFWRWIESVRGIPFGTRDWFWTLVRQLDWLGSSWLPSTWIAQGLQAAALGDLALAGRNLALVWSHGLFFYVAVVWLSRRLYRRGYNRMASGGSLRRKYGGQWLDACAEQLLFFVDGQTRLLIIKDFRTFRRDPAQWFQITLFLLMALFYFSSMRSFYQRDFGKSIQNGISLLTLLAIAFLCCAYTGRFIYPLLSLEGRKFWILGLLPLSRDRLLWGKFAFSTIGTLTVSVFLVVFSNIMLNMPWQVVAVHGLTIAVISCTLSGLSVGLGASMPNFRENDPSKIALGLGGTLNLVAGLLVLVVVACLMAGPWHLQLHFDPERLGPDHWLQYACLLVGAAFGVATTWLSLRSGIKTLRRMEF